MFTSLRAGALVALTLLPLALSAQETTAAAPVTPDVTVIVTDTMVPHPVSESIASTTVVTAQQIREEGAQTVADALRFVPGVTINQNGSLGAAASASIRGTKSTQVLVLIDGQRVNSSAFSSPDLSKFPVEEISRIEVVRGPVSSLYGSDAIGGVINIITKKPTTTGGDATLGFGSFGRAERATTIRDAKGRVAWQFTGTFPGFSGEQANTDFSASDFVGKLAATDVKGWDLAMRAETYHDDLGLRGATYYAAFGDYPDLDDRQSWVRNNIDLTGNRELFGGQLALRAYTLRQKMQNPRPTDPDWTSPTLSNFDTETHGTTDAVEATYTKEWSRHQFIAGSEYHNDRYQDEQSKNGAVTSTQDKSMNTRALYLQDRWQAMTATNVVLGARLDDYSTTGSHITPRIGITHTLSPRTSLRTSYNEGFRAPSLVDLYYTDGATTGNPNLRPETSKQYEVGYHTTRGKHDFDLAVFRNRVHDQIAWAPVGTTFVWLPQNVERVRQQGVEATWGVQVARQTSLDLSYTYLDARNEVTGNRLDRTPHNQVSVTATSRIKQCQLSLSGRYLDARPDATSGLNINASTVFDFVAQYQGTQVLKPYLVIRNLTNTSYEQVVGFPGDKRSIEVGVRSNW